MTIEADFGTYFETKLEELENLVKEKHVTVRRLEAQRNELNSRVRLLREELQLLLEPGAYIGEVVKSMGKARVLVKIGSEGKYIVDIDKSIDIKECVTNARVALKSDSYTLFKILPTKVDPLVSLMKVEKVPDSTYEMVGGLEKQVKEVKEVIELPIKHPEIFEALGISQPKGVLLYGPPGTGKTLLARAVAHHTDCTFIRVSGSELVQKYIGEGSRMVRELFVMAREHAPSIIFMDEIDSIGSSRVEGESGGDSEVQRTMLELLNQLDGFEATTTIKIIMATNRIDILDPALLRPGRIDRKIEFPNPNEQARAEILKIHSRKMNLVRGIDLLKIASQMNGASGAESKAVCTEAGMFALRERRQHVTQEDFEMAVAKVMKKDSDKNALTKLSDLVATGMRVRQMKSMTGWRRFLSDYGFEGIFGRNNIYRASNFFLLSIGFSSMLLSIFQVWARQPAPTSCVNFGEMMGTPFAEPIEQSEKKRLQSLIEPALRAHGKLWDDYQMAAAHFSNVESQLLEVDRFLLNLTRSEGPPQAAIHDFMESLHDPTINSLLNEVAKKFTTRQEIHEWILHLLVKSWVDSGSLDESSYPKRSVFGHRESSEATGVDIGCLINTATAASEGSLSHLSHENREEVVRSIQHWGFGLIKGAVTEKYVSSLLGSLLCDQSTASEIGERIIQMDSNISHNRAMPNRLQMILRGSELEALTQDLHAAVAPIIYRCHGIPKRLMVSDIRLMIIDHAAEAGNWTLFNPRGGYTCVIPLHERDSRAGTFSVLPGSHFLTDKSLNAFKRVLMMFERYSMVRKPVSISDLFGDGCWRAGDALLLDNRTLFRSQQNKIFKSGTYILIKYETSDIAQASLFLTGKFLFRFAKLLEHVSIDS